MRFLSVFREASPGMLYRSGLFDVAWLRRDVALRGASWICVLLVAMAVGCGAGVSPEQKQALARVQEVGGKINFKRGGYEVDFRNTGVQNADLAVLKHIPNLKNVDLQGTLVGDEGIAHLEGIETLEYVYLDRTAVTPAAAEKLQASVPNARVTHQGRPVGR